MYVCMYVHIIILRTKYILSQKFFSILNNINCYSTMAYIQYKRHNCKENICIYIQL